MEKVHLSINFCFYQPKNNLIKVAINCSKNKEVRDIINFCREILYIIFRIGNKTFIIL